MPQMQPWTVEEFAMLLDSAGLSDEEVAQQLPGRSVGAIGIVRDGIHSFHRGRNHSMLSAMMVQRLEGDAPFTCPRCPYTTAGSVASGQE